MSTTPLRKDNVLKISLALSFFLTLAFSLFLALSYTSLPPIIPVLNSLPWGPERLITKQAILALLPILFTVLVSNIFLSLLIYKKNILIARILTFNSVLFTLLTLLAYAQIVLLVL